MIVESSPRERWPMASYMDSWKVFRTLSNENDVTARALLERPAWPDRASPLRILDIGSGDGRLVARVAELCHNPVREVRLLDPDLSLLAEAEDHLSSSSVAQSVTLVRGGIADHLPTAFEGINVALAVHLVYLLNDEEFDQLLRALPPQVPLYVILDSPGSLFTRLWEITAPNFLERSMNAHESVQSLSDKYSVQISTILSRIEGLSEMGIGLQEAILSLLCYTDYPRLSLEMKSRVQSLIDNFTESETVQCESICYEIVRR